ncbi:hypothetical protein BaRGS_00006070 [Batillaria attramentaria]|uniref:CBM-cenC domain-containing protein n=1 Tax=Batillaria attramentaria TaxID=370345 RepID=A0ABD0LT76_9CAEN
MGTAFRIVVYFSVIACALAADLLRNGGVESLDGWNHCWNFDCELIPADESRFGSHSLRTRHRTQSWQGPAQDIHTTPGRNYRVESWVKLLNDKPGKLGQNVELEVSFEFSDGSHTYMNAALRPLVTTADGWIFLQGDFPSPERRALSQERNFAAATKATFYYQGPEPGVDFAVDLASITEIPHASDNDWRRQTDSVIDRIRKNDIHLRVTTASGIDPAQVKIQASTLSSAEGCMHVLSLKSRSILTSLKTQCNIHF